MREIQINSISEKAYELLIKVFPEKLQAPIQLAPILKYNDIKKIEHNLEDEISGVLIIEKEGAQIGVNSKHHLVRQRFTIAHEIGHFILKHTRPDSIFIDQPKKHMSVKLYRDGRSSTGDFWQEREANAFAASLLMPASLLIEKIQLLELDLSEDNSLTTLASEFKVSTQAMAIRLSSLGFLKY